MKVAAIYLSGLAGFVSLVVDAKKACENNNDGNYLQAILHFAKGANDFTSGVAYIANSDVFIRIGSS